MLQSSRIPNLSRWYLSIWNTGSSVDVILDNAQRLEDKVHNLLYLNRVEYLVTSDSEGVVTNMKEVVEEVVLNSAVIRSEIRVITEVEEVFFDGLLESCVLPLKTSWTMLLGMQNHILR